MGIAEDSNRPLPEILNTVQEYLRQQRNIALDRLNFVNRRQRGDETFSEYYAALREAAEDADLQNMDADTWLATLILVGVKEDTTRQKLLEEDTAPNLERTRQICLAQEKATRHGTSISAAGKDNNGDINATTAYKRGRSQQREQAAQKNRTPHQQGRGATGERTCPGCGKKPAHNRHDCPAQGKKCNKCGKKNHFASVCRSTDRVPNNDNKKGNVGYIHAVSSRPGNDIYDLPRVQVQVRAAQGGPKRMLTAVADSGASANVIGSDILKKLNIQQGRLWRTPNVLTAANNMPLKLTGRIPVAISRGDRSAKTSFYVSPEHKGALICYRTCVQLGIINEIQSLKATEEKPGDTKRAKSTDPAKIKAALLEEYADVFDNEDKPLPPMDGPPMQIELAQEAQPVCHTNPRPIPFAMRDEVKNLLDGLVKKQVLAKVEEPTEWVHPMTVVRKPSGKLRLCVDLRGLNKYVLRPHHPTRAPRDTIADIPADTHWFSTFDASCGYFQVPLHEDSQPLTTFITPWGRYKHLRTTMGLSSAGDEYNRRGDQALEGLENTRKLVDDVLVHDTSKDIQDHERRVRHFLDRCREAGITLNPSKFTFGAPEVKFAGYIVGREGIKADPEKIEALTKFPKPQNISDVRSFLGLVEQLAGYSKEVSGAMAPLRPLLSPKNAFIWTSDHDRAFQATKAALASPPVLQPFDPKWETTLHTDASRLKGLGFVLMQKNPKEQRWHLVECGSRFISPTESRYAMVELELLAVVWAVQKLRLYLLGLPHFKVVTDHKPLVGILDKQSLDAVDNGRLKRLKIKLAPYTFTTEWRKGSSHQMADSLSRAPVTQPTAEETKEAEELLTAVSAICAIHALEDPEETGKKPPPHLADPVLQKLRKAGEDDPTYLELLNAVKDGAWNNTRDEVKAFRKHADTLSVDDGLVLLGHRVVVPRGHRREVLLRLHASHQGTERTQRRARQSVWWPGITSDIKSMVENCDKCQLYRPSQPRETLKTDPPPQRVFEEIGADFFEVRGQHYLVVVDRLSGFPLVYPFSAPPTAKSTIGKLVWHFAHYGVPVVLRSDGGLQFASEKTRAFLANWGVNHVMSTPHYPQSNGLAESAVKATKALLKKTGSFTDEFHEGMLELRNTPRDGGKSPAEIVTGRPLRSRVPTHWRAFSSENLKTMEQYDATRAELAKKTEERYNASAKDLPEIGVGSFVRVQDPVSKLWDRTGHVVSRGKSRDYRIKMPSGRVLWRNRRFLKPAPEPNTGDTASPPSGDKSPGPRKEPEEADQASSTPGTPASGRLLPRRSSRVRFKPDRLHYH